MRTKEKKTNNTPIKYNPNMTSIKCVYKYDFKKQATLLANSTYFFTCSVIGPANEWIKHVCKPF